MYRATEINIQAIKVPFYAVGNEMNIECILQKHKVEISCFVLIYMYRFAQFSKLNLVFEEAKWLASERASKAKQANETATV